MATKKKSRSKAKTKAQATTQSRASAKAKTNAKTKKPPTKRAKQNTRPISTSTSSYWSTATSSNKTTKQRIAALSRLPAALCEDQQKFDEVLGILRDTSQPASLRYAALQSLQAATFSAANFDSCRPEYLATLRSLVNDPDLELRQRVLGMLAREHDGSTQQLLLDGLKHPGRAVVPPEKALQLLGYDIHTDAYDMARQIVTNPPNEAARLEALRLLGADATSATMFESLLRDKKETANARRLAATALQAMAPDRLQASARDIVEDESDDEEVKATSLTALTDLGQPGAVTDRLYQSVNKLSKSKSNALKTSARRFIGKYQR